MKRLIPLMLLMLAACGPQLATQYEMVPPRSASGRMCANDCLANKNVCDADCWDRKARCEQWNDMDMHLGYMMYGGRGYSGFGVGTHDHFNDRRCDADACLSRCTQNLNVCHTNCGGQVIERTYCTAFCGPPQ